MAIVTQGPGVLDGGTDRVEMLLKQFGGEVIAEFDKAFKLRTMHRVKALKPGRKADVFPALGRTGSKYHQAGDNLLTDAGFLQSIAQGDKTIWADRECVSALAIDAIEERLSYWPDRQEYSKQLAYALAKQADQNVIRVLARAARRYQAVAYTGAPQGEYIVPLDVGGVTGTSFTAAQFVDALLRAQRLMDEKDVPMEERFALIRPTEIEMLLKSSASRDILNKDFNPPNGSIAAGTVGMAAGFQLIKTNNFPTAAHTTRINQISGTDLGGNDYRVDLQNVTDAGGGNLGSATRALCFTREAVGSVVSAEIGMESEWKIELRADLIIASYAMGHGELRPECVVEIACNTKPSAP